MPTAQRSYRRTPTQRVHDQAEIARSYLRGEPQHAIATRLGISQQQVSFDLGIVRAAWQHSAVRDFDAHKAEELAKLDALEAQYWLAWERSQNELTHSSSEKIDDEISMPGGRRGVRIKVPRTRTRAQMRKEQQVGNSAFLFGIERCIEQRCKILGLYAPTDVALSGTLSFGQLYELAQQTDADPESGGLRALPGA